MRLVAAQLGSLTDVLVVADALHAQTGHAELLAAEGAHLMVTVKGNQPTLFAQLKAMPWAQIPIGHQTRETGHGRKETRTVKAVTAATPGGLAFPHAQQAVRITRTRTIKDKTTREMAYLTMSLPAEQAQPADLGTWARCHQHRRSPPRSQPPPARPHHRRDRQQPDRDQGQSDYAIALVPKPCVAGSIPAGAPGQSLDQ
jgi:hypothetical protein